MDAGTVRVWQRPANSGSRAQLNARQKAAILRTR